MNTAPSVFTRIINREIPAAIIYEDARTIAFLTIEPITLGHTLVVPKTPFTNLFDAPAAELAALMVTAATIAKAQVACGLGSGVNLIMNNGASAGQEVFHAHLHLVPRTDADNALTPPAHISYTGDEATIIANAIAEAIE